jgi:hypothetical protein
MCSELGRYAGEPNKKFDSGELKLFSRYNFTALRLEVCFTAITGNSSDEKFGPWLFF